MNGNLAINLFNLLPIYPLDGFRILNSALQMFTPYKQSLKFSCIFSLFIFLSILSLKISEYIEFEKRKQTW